MKGHPGGEGHTRRILELAGLPKGAKILDMGAGAGEAVLLMRALGYEASGIDCAPRAFCVSWGDFLQTGLPDASFDAVLSQCAFFLSGNPEKALLEAHRLLKSGGKLLLSDVFPAGEDPAALLERNGFSVLVEEDMTEIWKAYFIDALWRSDVPCTLPRVKCTYHLLIGRRNENGSV